MYLHELWANLPEDIRSRVECHSFQPTQYNSLKLYFDNGYGVSIQWGDGSAAGDNTMFLADNEHELMLWRESLKLQVPIQSETAEVAILYDRAFSESLNVSGTTGVMEYVTIPDILKLCRELIAKEG